MAGSVLEIEEDDFGTEGEEDSTPVVVIEPNQTSVVVQAQDLVVEVPNDEVEVISVAKQGPQGPPGVDGGSFYHSQAAVSSTWVVAHNLGYRPNVTTFNSADMQVEGGVVHDSANQLTVTFSSAFSGYAVLS